MRAREERGTGIKTDSDPDQAQAEAELEALARQTLELLQDHLLRPAFDQPKKVPALIVTLDGHGSVEAEPAPAQPLQVIDASLGEILIRLQRAQVRAGKVTGCTVFRLHPIEEVAAHQEQFVLTGYDLRHDMIFVNLLKIGKGNKGLRLQGSHEIAWPQLQAWLEEGVLDVERKDREADIS